MKDIVQGALNFVNNVTNRDVAPGVAAPDFSKFLQKIAAEDLSRPNLFLVRFVDFSSVLSADGIINPTFGNAGSVSKDSSLIDNIYGFAKDKLYEYGPGLLLKTETGKKILGAYNPKLLKTILPGEFIDGILPSGFDINKDIAMLCKAVTLPGEHLSVQQNLSNRIPITHPMGRAVDNIRMTFYLRTNHTERNVFKKWMDMSHNNTNNTYGLWNTYAKAIEIYPLNRQGVPMSVVRCSGCFPVSLQEVALDTDSNNTVTTFDVSFAVSTIQSQAFEGESPFLNEAISIYKNVRVNPLTGKLFK